MPDALSKTIPIWIAVLNCALWPDDLEAGRLRTPRDVVSGSENAMMAERIERFVEDFRALGLDLQDLRRKVGRPMRARWVTPDSDLEDLVGESEEEEGKEGRWNTIYLVTASRCISGTEASAGGYIQGSGDDTENWAHGLTPSIFWENKDILLETPEAKLSGLIERLVMKDGMRKLEVRKGDEGKERFDAVPPTANLRVIAISALRELREDEVRIVLLPTATPSSSWLECGSAETEGDAERKESAESGKKSKVLELGIGTGKLASRALRTALPVVFSFLSFHLTPTLPPTTSTFDPNSPPQGAKPKHITIACPDARDLSVGVALAILCKLYDDSGAMSMEGKAEGKRKVDKLLVKKRLNWITAWKPDANPSRSTLQSVNTVLMGWE